MTASHDVDDLETLIGEFAASGMMTLHLRSAGFELLLSNDASVGSVRNGAVPSAYLPVAGPAEPVRAETRAATASAAVKSSVDLPDDALIVKAPTLGTFYRAPKPGAAAYVEIGSTVEAGAELCLIEVMKLFTAVRAERPGRLHAILADDGAMVEAGQPLFALVDA